MFIVKMSCCYPTPTFRMKRPNGVLADTRWVEILLWALAELCLPPPYLLPASGLVSDCFYNLTGWQKCYFEYVLNLSVSERNLDENIAAALITPFRQLNSCLKWKSWYLNAHEADCESIQRVLECHGATIERVCDSHDEQYLSVCGEKQKWARESADIVSDWLTRGEILSIRIAKLLDRRDKKHQRVKKWRPT